jgi:hypothetical protein
LKFSLVDVFGNAYNGAKSIKVYLVDSKNSLTEVTKDAKINDKKNEIRLTPAAQNLALG